MSAPSPGGGEGPGRAQERWTVLELLRTATAYFGERGLDTARLDAECLLACVLGHDRLSLYTNFEKPVTDPERDAFRELVRRRASERVPVSQLVGRKEFWSLSLSVTPDVLTPRPDTETLVETALALLPEKDAPARVLDLGTGSGAVALALAVERPAARVTGTDVSPAALAVARENARALGLGERVEWLKGSLFEPLAGRRFDLVLSNPPYLAERERAGLAPELAHEPELALFGGEDGLAVLRPLCAGVPALLAPGGAAAFEIAPEQAEAVCDWCRAAGLLDVTGYRDLAGRVRVVAGRARG